jgi:hypothetical protein
MPGTTKIAIIAAVALLLPVVLVAAAVGGLASMLTGNSTTDCTAVGSTAAVVAGYRPDQMANAATIVAAGKQLNVPIQGWVVAIAASLQESGLRNLDHGDRDSLGRPQQRPSQGWGAPTQIMNPTYAATQFYRHLLAVPRWQQLSVNDAAQAVEHSGFPDAYAQHEQEAREIVAAVAGATCTGITVGTGDCDHIQAPNAAALAAINYACGQRGLPYVVTDPLRARQDSTAPVSPTLPTPQPVSSCPESPKTNTTPARYCPQVNHSNPATSSSSAPAPPPSLTSASPSRPPT